MTPPPESGSAATTTPSCSRCNPPRSAPLSPPRPHRRPASLWPWPPSTPPARPKAIRELLLDDVDLGNRRLIIAGHARPLDEFTHRAILDWLDYRHSRWPNTANPHVIVNQQSALETGPVSKVWITNALRGLTATLERLRVDRQLEEALTHGPDPLHLATVFGIDEKTAIRYATTARQLLQTPARMRHSRLSEPTGPTPLPTTTDP